LEWRLPEASAIYWAVVGLEKSNDKDLLNLRRVIYQCMHTVVLRGRIVHVRQSDGLMSYGPDLTKISLAHEGYLKMLAEEKEKPDAVTRAHRNFLKEVVYLLYARNRREEAEQWMKILRERYPEAVPKDQTAEQFALARLTEGISNANHNRTRALIESLLFSHFESLAVDDDDHAAGLLLMASKVNDYYNEVISKRGAPLRLDPFAEMYQRVRDELLSPQSGMAPAYRARLRTKLGLGNEPPPAPATNAPPATAAPKSG